MDTITLQPRKGFDISPMEVTTDRTHWPKLRGKSEALNRFHGVGELRSKGYDLSPVRGHGTVYQVQ
jgi:hypothetical protein